MTPIESENSYIEQNMTDISLSALGIVLIILVYIIIIYKTAPDYIQERIKRETKSISEKKKIVEDINGEVEELLQEGLSLERVNAYIDKSLNEVEEKKNERDKKKATLSNQIKKLSLLRDIGFLKNEKRKIILANQSKLELINEMKGRVVTIEGRGQQSGWQKDTSGRLYFVYTSRGETALFDGMPIEAKEFEGIISWFTRENAVVVAKYEGEDKPYWIGNLFDRYGWGPATMELK